MSSDNSSNGGGGGGAPARRSSFSQSTLSSVFQRGNSVSGPSTQPIPVPSDPQRRRLSITTLGLSGTTPNSTVPYGIRRGSVSTNSGSIDEDAIEDDDGVSGSARTAPTPTAPFTRHMSFGAPTMRTRNGNNPTSPPPQAIGRRASVQRVPSSPSHDAATTTAARRASAATPSASSFVQASNIKHPRTSSDNPFSRADQQGYNWSEQLRSRAESSVTGARPSFSFASGSSSPPRVSVGAPHDRAKSVSEMPQPPVQAPTKPRQERPKPDAFQERILKGDFYMD